MKIIDLLNKIANGEAPKKFKYRNRVFYSVDNDYWCDEIGGWFSVEVLDISILNEEVEIIEEDKKIEKLDNEHKFYCYTQYESYKNDIDKVLYIIKAINYVNDRISNSNNKINELIEEIEKLKGKSE